MLRSSRATRPLTLLVPRRYIRTSYQSNNASKTTHPSNSLAGASPQAHSSTNSNHIISHKQHLYLTDPITPGSIFFLPHGTRIFNTLVQFMKNQQTRYGFDEVITPLIYKSDLWRRLGHLENYKDDMFRVMSHGEESDGHHYDEYGLKPMNCPGHCLMFSKSDHSYNELPVRYSDFSALHRNEASGALSGLTRVRCFHQDDGHIFCELSQIELEIENTLALIKDSYGVFGIKGDDLSFFLSTRPLDSYIGSLDTWDQAESLLRKVLDRVCGAGKWEIRPEDGAFYGPKIDVILADAFGKSHQVGTVQLDFQLPKRFDLQYTGRDGDHSHRPVLVHRAVFGSLERFIAILLDHYAGKWPFWLNPRQAVVVSVNESHVDAAQAISRTLQGDIVTGATNMAPLSGHHFHVDVDLRNETVGSRIKDAVEKGYSFIVLVGDKEIESGKVAVRTRDSRAVKLMDPQDLYKEFMRLERGYL